MKSRIVLALITAASAAITAQEPQLALPTQQSEVRRDDGYRSGYTPESLPLSVDDQVKDDPEGRREALKEQFGGEFTPEFMAAITDAANQQVAQYGPAGRGGIKVPAGGNWTNVGPYRSDWIQNGVRLTESDTGRRAHLPRAPDQCRRRLRAQVKRRFVEDDELLAYATELASDDR
jgi:hypothetical protein